MYLHSCMHGCTYTHAQIQTHTCTDTHTHRYTHTHKGAEQDPGLFCRPRNCHKGGLARPTPENPWGEWQLGTMAIKQAVKACQVDWSP